MPKYQNRRYKTYAVQKITTFPTWFSKSKSWKKEHKKLRMVIFTRHWQNLVGLMTTSQSNLGDELRKDIIPTWFSQFEADNSCINVLWIACRYQLSAFYATFIHDFVLENLVWMYNPATFSYFEADKSYVSVRLGKRVEAWSWDYFGLLILKHLLIPLSNEPSKSWVSYLRPQ